MNDKKWLKAIALPLLAGLTLVVLPAAAGGLIRKVFDVPGYRLTEFKTAEETKPLVAESESGSEPEKLTESASASDERKGFYEENGVLYYYNDDGSLYEGWLLQDGSWYYFTDQGAVTGYCTIGEYGREEECYFGEDGRLAMDVETPDGRMADSDGYLEDANEKTALEEAWSEFELEAARVMAPGTLSGLSIAGEPAEFYMLSIAGESSGGEIILGDRGRGYGLCQFDYRYDLVDFIRWAYEQHSFLWQEFAKYTDMQAGDEALVYNAGIVKAFENARNRNYEAAISDELEYMRRNYWDNFAAQMNAAGFRLSERHVAVSAALFSVNVNCGNQLKVMMEHLSPDMTDAEMICEIYRIRNTILAEQKVGTRKKGTTTRYRMAEPRMALDLLHGFTTIDSVRDYGGGVQWNGDLFVSAVLTREMPGTSTEWEETEQAEEVEDAEEIFRTARATPADAQAAEPFTEE